MFFNIIIDNEKKGRITNSSDLLKLFNKEQMRIVFENNAYEEMEQVFSKAKRVIGEETFSEKIGNISIEYITDGITVHTLIFYFN